MDKEDKHHHTRSVHKVLAHSYATYFTLFLLGVALDMVFHLKFFNSVVMAEAGGVIFVLATMLIFWAQKTSRHLDVENLSHETFSKGPYSFTRNPTNLGLFFMMLGFGVMLNAIFVVLSTLVSFLLSRLIFIEKQENILAQKYGSHYLEYQKKVKF